MKHRSLFVILMAVFLVLTLVIISTISVLFYLNTRKIQTENRIEALKAQARDVAYLAGLMQDQKYSFSSVRSMSESNIYWKTNEIYQEYNAYTVIVERNGSAYAYYTESTLEDTSLNQLPGREELSEYLQRAAQGEEIAVQGGTSGSPLFTVIVPWQRESLLTGETTVMGIVMIQTAAQNIRATYSYIVWPLIFFSVCFYLLAAAVIYVITKRITRPLRAIADTAIRMTNGDLSARAPLTGSKETIELSSSFNQMAQELENVETSRRSFIANVSHELRSPITSIQGFAQGMLDGTIPKEQQAGYLTVITDETHRLSKLIQELLQLSRMENDTVALNMTVFDINELMRRVIIQHMSSLESKNISLSTDFPDDPCPVYADKDQIEQVLINLVDNAIKFLQKEGTLLLTSACGKEQVICHVIDNGPGILPEDADHIFERFYKGDKAHTTGQGTGLGLSICKMILEKHGQKISLVSGKNGADFMFTLQKAPKQGSL